MKAYFFTMTLTHFRTCEHVGKITGVVLSDNEFNAREKAWSLAGSDFAYNLDIYEIDMKEGYKFTVYKSEM